MNSIYSNHYAYLSEIMGHLFELCISPNEYGTQTENNDLQLVCIIFTVWVYLKYCMN